MKTNNKYISLLLATALLLGLCTGFAPAAWAAGVDITEKFTDPNFRAAVYEVIGKSEGEVIWDTDVAGVSTLQVDHKDIRSLAGLEYFTGLEKLWCWNNQLTALPPLPSGLLALICYSNQLTSLSVLPSGLIVLQCGDNQLTSLPALPSGLTYLSCDDNRLTTLPALPSRLTELLISNNQITSLPTLPLSLIGLNCGNNPLTLPTTLPSCLEWLSCFGLNLMSLPVLPPGLTILSCGNNQLTSLPALPKYLAELDCSGNRLTGMDVSGSIDLFRLNCSYNNMTSPSAVKGFTGTWDWQNNTFYPQNPGFIPPLSGLSSWAEPEANSLNERGVIPDALKNNFQKPIRRDEFTAILANIIRFSCVRLIPHNVVPSPFADIADSAYRKEIEIAYEIGLVDGTSPTKFTPDGLLTREQTAKLLYTLVDKIDGAELGNAAPDFTDSAAISDWARPYVAWCQQNGVMQGTATGKFDPLGNLTREQAMLVCERLIVKFGW